jgi:nicotinamide-nucleotide amidase
MPTAELVSIGSELLLGQIVDTNSAWMAQRLTSLGVDLFRTTTVGDNRGRMLSVLDQALDRADIVICGGGLGPTQDDITREAIATVTGRELVVDADSLERIKTMFAKRGFEMTINNERQALIPQGAQVLHNPNGTAPAFAVTTDRGVVFALPGVPFELKWLFDNEVVPSLRRHHDLAQVLIYRVLKVASMGESSVDTHIGDLIAHSSNPTVGVLAHPGQVDVRIAAKAESAAAAAQLIAPVEQEVRSRLGQHIFASDAETMESVVGNLLRQRDAAIACYEDVTGGMLAERLREASGELYLEGLVGNDAGAGRRLLARAGAEPTTGAAFTEQLALAIRSQAGCKIGIAVHGVPDPAETAENLSRGTTHIVIADGARLLHEKLGVAGYSRPDRTRISLTALALLRRALRV